MLYYLGVSAALGLGMAVAAFVLPADRGGVLLGRLRRLAPAVAVFVAVTALLHLGFAVAESSDGGLLERLSWHAFTAYIDAPARGGGPSEGTIALAQLAGYALTIGCLMWLRLRGCRAAGAATAVCAALTATLPVLPLAATTASSLPGQLLTTVHVLGATVWIGGLVVLATAGLQGRRSGNAPGSADPSGELADEWRRVWERFSLTALFAVGALIVSGSWLAWSHVGAAAQFVTTAYGRYLGLKLILVVLLLVAGAYNVRVLIPRIRSARDRGDARTAIAVAVHHFPVVVAVEAVLASGVLVIVPFLRGSARSEADWPNAGPFDAEVFGVGVLLVALLGAAFWLGTRTPTGRRVAAENPTG